MKKGQKMTEEQKEKIRQSNVGKKHNITSEGYAKMEMNFIKGGWNKGKKSSLEWREKLRQAKKGKSLPLLTRIHMIDSAKRETENHQWKGDFVGYRALHYWVERQFGKPVVCEFCKETKNKIHWANKSHHYKRNLFDWIRLCAKCHKQYDLNYCLLTNS